MKPFGLHHNAFVAETILEGKRVRLCPAREQDAAQWMRVRGFNRALLESLEPAWPADALSEAFFKRRVERLRLDWKDDRAASFLIWLKGSAGVNTLIGGFNLNNIARAAAQNATLGYWLCQSMQGKGLMNEAARLACDFAFGPFGLHRLHAATLPDNAPSQALLKRLGFVEEGFARSYVQIDGTWRDHVLFGLVADDWRARRIAAVDDNGF